jgi:S-adenosylmethionine synthetase
MKSYFTSESVTCGHPDKVCDQVADAILDAILEQDPYAHTACEVTAWTDHLHIMGEITANAMVDYAAIARRVIRHIGYTTPGHGFDADSCNITVDIHTQSPDIAVGVNRRDPLDTGAGDQGMMFGYACDETDMLMPLPITLANALTMRLEYVRTAGILPYLLPDGKSQVTVEYEDGTAKRISTVILSAQHTADITTDALRTGIIENVISPALPAALVDRNTIFYINPTGRFAVGGPAGDTGLTGRKIIADTYGGMARHGGGAFSGKDPTKVDRSGAYMARYIAKNIVKAGLANRCEVQLSYAIGLSEPISLLIDTFGTGEVSPETISNWITAHVDLRPAAIIDRFRLCRPCYQALACHGHFGANASEMGWERTDLADAMRIDLLLNRTHSNEATA